MADNLNVTSNPTPDTNAGGDINSINNAPTQSPLEQSGPSIPPAAANPAPAETSPVPGDNAMAEPPSFSQPEAPAPLDAPQESAPTPSPSIPTPPPVTPPSAEADLGQSSTPPDTDEFLKSILQEQPQPQQPSPEVLPESPINPPVETSPINPPLQEQTPAPIENQPLQTPSLNEAPIGQPAPQEPTPMPTNPVETTEFNQPAPMADFPQEQKLTDNTGIDGLDAVSQPNTPPAPPQVTPDTPVSSDVFGGAPGQPGGSSGVKKVIIAALVLVVLAGGYYAYMMFSGTSATPTPKNSVNTTQSVTTNNQLASEATGDSQRKADLRIIQEALINYRSASNKFPVSANYTFLNVSGNLLEKELVPVYLEVLPQDPSPSKAYAYKSDGTTFTLTAELDNQTDPEVVMDNGKALYRIDEKSTSSTTSTNDTGATTFPGGSNVDTAQTGVLPSSTSTVSGSSSLIDDGPPIPTSPN